MSQALVIDNYSFNKTAKTITFNQYPSVRLEGIKLITNVTTGTIIYQFNASAKLGTVSNNILTLAYDTSAMSDADKLMIIYDPPTGGFFDVVQGYLYQIMEFVRWPSYLAKSAGVDKVQVLMSTDSTLLSVNTINTLTALTTLANLTNFNTIDSRELVWNLWDTEYNTGIRSKIT